jgi:hypothetical protein
LERGGGDGDAEDGQDGARGDHAGKMGRAARSGDDDAKAAGGGGVGVAEEKIRSPVGGDDLGFVRDAELAEDVDGGAHDGVVVLAAHDDADEGDGVWCSGHGGDYTRMVRWRVVGGKW